MGSARFALPLAAMLVAQAALADPPDKRFDALVRAYGDRVSGFDLKDIVWRDGTRLSVGPADPGKSFAAALTHATIRDMFRLAYPVGTALAPPAVDFDPGRFRNKAFFDRLYGDCRKDDVARSLVAVTWLPKSWGHKVMFAARAAAALHAVSDEIERMPPSIRRAAWPSAGTFACRGVADQGQPSMHAYGAAIDLNLRYSDYWLWETKPGGKPAWRNRMPREIVAAFERHGFIWGGRWYHYDTMHFEYRPELAASR